MDTGKLLNEVFNELSREVRSNPDLGMRLGKIIEKYIPDAEKRSVRPHRRKTGAFDPVAVYRQDSSKLKSRLEELNIEELKDIIADQGMDRSKLAMKWKTKERLINLIVATVESRIHKCDAFRTLPLDIDNTLNPHGHTAESPQLSDGST